LEKGGRYIGEKAKEYTEEGEEEGAKEWRWKRGKEVGNRRKKGDEFLKASGRERACVTLEMEQKMGQFLGKKVGRRQEEQERKELKGRREVSNEKQK
jgi:hypothetical protein